MFGHVKSVDLEGYRQVDTVTFVTQINVTDADLENLTEMPQLHTLQVVSTKVTDAGLLHLKGLNQLKKLTLIEPHFTDAGLRASQGTDTTGMVLDLVGT